ncbi:hypothetical protein MPER_08766 [Moniliophthora perniciosa FA553]|nr:hypothetical protein MPER_08766 [Moniliophthora perniciosa FA553]
MAGFSSKGDDNFCFPIPDQLQSERPAFHAEAIFEAIDQSLWQYLPFGPFDSAKHFVEVVWEGRMLRRSGETLFVVQDKTKLDTNGEPALAGTIGYVNASAEDLQAEIGCIVIASKFQRTHVASNAVGLLMQYALNLPEQGGVGWSIRLAEKMGFVQEGTLRWHRVLEPSKAIGGNGKPERKGDPREGSLGRDSTLLATYWDTWEDGLKDKVNRIMAK